MWWMSTLHAGGHGMFETLHGFADVGGIFSGAEVPGAGRKFMRRLLRAKKKNLSALKEFIKER